MICNFSYFPFCLNGGFWVLIASVPGVCIRFTVTTGEYQNPHMCYRRVGTALNGNRPRSTAFDQVIAVNGTYDIDY